MAVPVVLRIAGKMAVVARSACGGTLRKVWARGGAEETEAGKGLVGKPQRVAGAVATVGRKGGGVGCPPRALPLF